MLGPTTSSHEHEDTEFLSVMKRDAQTLFALLLHHGAIVLRGFPVTSAEAFNSFLGAIFSEAESGLVHGNYSGASVRHQVVGNVLTANDAPADQKIPFHHETSQLPNHVTHVAFYCETPPAQGGETPILSSVELAQRLKTDMPEFAKNHAKRALMTHITLPVDDTSVNYGRGWYKAWQTKSREEAVKKLPPSCTTRWVGPYYLCMQNIYECNTFIHDFRTDQEVFFNQVVGVSTVQKDIPHVFARFDSFPTATLEELKALSADSTTAPYESEDDLSNYLQQQNIHAAAGIMDDDLRLVSNDDSVKICAIAEDIKVEIAWKANDIMILDNRLVQHSRNPFTAPRSILAGLLYESLEWKTNE